VKPDEFAGSSGLVRAASKPGARLVVSLSLGLAFFLLGSTYLSLSESEDVTSVILVGGERLRAGATAHLRVQARRQPTRTAVPVQLERLTFDGAEVTFEQHGESPAMIGFKVPQDAGDTSSLVLMLKSGEDRKSVMIAQEVLHVTPDDGDLRMITPVVLPKVATAHRVQLNAEQGELVLGMETRLFLRVRTKKGAPISLAQVQLKHRNLPNGALELITDSDGLCEFSILADQPTLRIDIEVRVGDELTKTDELLRPRGRLLTLVTERPVTPVNERVRLTLKSWRPEVEATCDLLWQGAWVWSEQVTTKKGRATIDLGLLESGRYDLQCSPHSIDPGETWASVPIFVDDRPALEVLEQAIEEGGHVHPDSMGFDAKAPTERALDFLAALLRADVVKPHVLASTRQADLQLEKETRQTTQGWLLLAMAIVALVVLLFVADLLIGHSLATRERMRAFAVDDLLEGDFDPDEDLLSLRELAHKKSMLRTRGTLLVFILLGTLFLNAAGILAALYLTRGG
jgi:hypothetical protein